MGIDSGYGYINQYFGMMRLNQAMSTGILQKVPRHAQQEADVLFSGSSGERRVPRATYEHPFLGKVIDILI